MMLHRTIRIRSALNNFVSMILAFIHSTSMFLIENICQLGKHIKI